MSKTNFETKYDYIDHVYNSQDLAHRENVILLGDSLGDANMSDGVPHATVLKIGFLSANVSKL